MQEASSMIGRLMRSVAMLLTFTSLILFSVTSVTTSSVRGVGFPWAGNRDSPQPSAFGDYQYTITHTGIGYPYQLALNSTGHLYVACYDYHQVQVFNNAGTFLYAIGTASTQGTGNYEFSYVYGVAVNSTGHVFVVDTGNHRVQVYNNAGTYIRTIGTSTVSGSDNAHFNAPVSVAVNSITGDVYVVDGSNNHRVQVFNNAGVYQATIGTPTVSGADNAHFYSPFGVAVDGSGNVYVVDSGNYRVQVFNSARTYVRTMGVTGVLGHDNAHFNMPTGVGISAAGHVFVADTYNHRVQVFNSAGTYLRTIGVSEVSGNDNSHLNAPRSVAVNATGYVYISDTGNARVQVLDGNNPSTGPGPDTPPDETPGFPVLVILISAGIVTLYLARRLRRAPAC
jgi:DNA-binding beta-propeller fold protein YncE